MSDAIVVDASFALAIILEGSAPAEDIFAASVDGGGTAWVPALWPFEVANGVAVAARRGRLTHAEAETVMRRLHAMPVETDVESIAKVWTTTSALALRHRLTMYDAAYLELVLRQRAMLASLDKALVAAAHAEGVRVL